MGYRVDKKPAKPEDMLPTFCVRNGGTLRLNFNCYYINQGETHDPHYHDYINWPAPDYHGNACQMIPPRDRPPFPPHMKLTADELEPIDLDECQYESAKVTYENPEIEQYLDTKCWIDDEDPSIVKYVVNTNLDNFADKPKDVRFTIYLKRTIEVDRGEDTMQTYDTLCHCILSILPGKPVPSE